MKTVIIVVCTFCAFMVNIKAQNVWTQKTDFGGTGRFAAVAFAIGNKGYLGSGDANTGYYEQDFWEYDPSTDTWMQKANLAGQGRWGAVGFSIGSKGYIATGAANSGPYLSDLWEYDTLLNQWNQKAPIPIGRYDAGVFVVGMSAYIIGGGCSGNPQYLKDTWEYNSISDIWIQRADFGGGKRFEPTTFAIGNIGYCGFGDTTISSDGLTKDFWAFNTTLNTWSQVATFPGLPRADAVGFSINALGFIATGWMTTGFGSQDFWMYNPAQNAWTQLPNFEGSPRVEARGFVINNHGYIGTGSVGGTYVNDFWEYTPDSMLGISEQIVLKKIVLNQNVPNPFAEQTTITYFLPDNATRAQILFFEQSGKIIKTIDIKEKGKGQLNVFANDLSSGIYTYSLIVDGQVMETKKMIKAK